MFFDPESPYGIICPLFPDPEEPDEGSDRDAGDFDNDEYGPYYDKLKLAA